MASAGLCVFPLTPRPGGIASVDVPTKRKHGTYRAVEARQTSCGAARTARFPLLLLLPGRQSAPANKARQRESSAVIKAGPHAYKLAELPQARQQKVLEFECRGCEFVEFRPDGSWQARGLDSGTVFNDIDLTEGDWFDYDEKAGAEVSIKELKWDIARS